MDSGASLDPTGFMNQQSQDPKTVDVCIGGCWSVAPDLKGPWTLPVEAGIASVEKTGKSFSTTPDIASLPCTSDAFIPNIYRGHRQAIYWESVISADSPQLNPLLLRWEERVPR